ncbi:sugar transferase [Roseovarius sp. Pro17]|uniref:sugar transferase n=1 Tax=Roseovarius sp. Pro17 TaxID=3108175 RepID=UPI002D768CCF|nr:sugar transferase [Roseovarius sp. Pro17]
MRKFDGDPPLGHAAKRIFDILFAIVAISASLGVVLISALWIKAVSRGPAFFVHYRIGFGGEEFPCLKLRTMTVDANERLEAHLAENPEDRKEFELNQKLKHDPRIVPGIGNFLRKTSLDELPQFLNVLLGHMSIVGPRPVTDAELDRYGMHQSAYLATRPGITGLWQVSGRNTLSFEDRVEIDSEYVKNWSMTRDLEIVVKTVKVVLTGEGAC